MPGTASEFEGFGDGEEKFFREGAADELDADGEAIGGSFNRDGEAGKSGEVEPLGVAHSFAVAANFFGWVLAGPGFPSAFAVAESRRG